MPDQSEDALRACAELVAPQAYGADGSLRIYVQAEAPAAARAGNWLPAPREPFYLCLRCYGPQPALLDGKWVVPVVARQAT